MMKQQPTYWHDPNEQKPYALYIHGFASSAKSGTKSSMGRILDGYEFTKKNAALLESMGYEILWGSKFGHRCNEQACKQIKQALQTSP